MRLSELMFLGKNDAAVRAIFDHLRNTGICSAVITVGWWVAKPGNPQAQIPAYVMGGMLLALGLWLLLINITNGAWQLKRAGFAESRVFILGQVFVLAASAMVLIPLVR